MAFAKQDSYPSNRLRMARLGPASSMSVAVAGLGSGVAAVDADDGQDLQARPLSLEVDTRAHSYLPLVVR